MTVPILAILAPTFANVFWVSFSSFCAALIPLMKDADWSVRLANRLPNDGLRQSSRAGPPLWPIRDRFFWRATRPAAAVVPLRRVSRMVLATFFSRRVTVGQAQGPGC